MNEFFSDLKGAFKQFKFTSPDIDSHTAAQRFLRAARPIVLASTFVLVLGIMNSTNDEYKQLKNKKKQSFDEDVIQEGYSKIREKTRPIFLRYLDLTISHTNEETIQPIIAQITTTGEQKLNQ